MSCSQQLEKQQDQATEFKDMEGTATDERDDEFDWNTEDELEIENYPLSTSPCLTPGGEVLSAFGSASVSAEASLPAGSSDPRLFDDFVGMGFPENMVAKALKENSDGNVDLILEYLQVSLAPGSSPQEQQSADSDCLSSNSEGSLYEERTDIDSSESEMSMNFISEDNKKLKPLVEMGYSMDEAFIAYERCGPDATLAELADFIFAAQLAKEEDARLGPPPEVKRSLADLKKRKLSASGAHERKAQRRCRKDPSTEDEENIHLPNPMIGFGVPNESYSIVNRRLQEVAMGPPYFYYENVALAPKGVWDTISRFLYEIKPEFVDSKYFCAAARKRGYIHNLPVNNRFPLLPLPPQKIHEALPMTKRWWPSWDTRTKFNCLMTSVGSAKLTERIWKALEQYNGEPPPRVQKYVIEECRKWNLVWVGRNKAAPLEPAELEMLLGFPRNHTRGGGISRTDRYKSLGNSFQVDTVAYHLSALKDLYPKGINVLSLFSGIGGAEVALHRLEIALKNVVEISEVNRNIMRSWWEQTNQKGNLVDIADIQQVDDARLGQLMDAFGGFDLVVGGSPCNNLTGNNRYTRDGLEGKESSLFFDYFRILDSIMSRRRCDTPCPSNNVKPLESHENVR